MGQHVLGFIGIHAVIALAIIVGCDSPPPAQSNPSKRPTVASIVPAATDLIVAMGAADHLVAVSNQDRPRDAIAALPRVGDYQEFDWERLSVLRPDIMIVFMSPERMPAALKQRAADLQIRLVNVRTERLEDVFVEMKRLGGLLNEPDLAGLAEGKLRGELQAVRDRMKGRPRIRTLLVREKDAQAVVGRENFLNDLLEIAGGENVLTEAGWPNIDAERLAQAGPQVIIQLLPDASPQVKAEAMRTWSTLKQIPAVSTGRVYVIDDWWAQQPGSHMGELAKRMAQCLHPDAGAGP